MGCPPAAPGIVEAQALAVVKRWQVGTPAGSWAIQGSQGQPALHIRHIRHLPWYRPDGVQFGLHHAGQRPYDDAHDRGECVHRLHVLTPEGSEPYSVDGASVMVCQFTYNSKLIVDYLEGHDLVIVPRGALHFIINTGDKDARLLSHYSNQFPTMGVTSDFFPNLPANMAEGLMGITKQAAAEMSRPGFKSEPFQAFQGDWAALHEWAKGKPTYNVLNVDDETDKES